MNDQVQIVCPKCNATIPLKPDAKPESMVTCGKCGTAATVPPPGEAKTILDPAAIAGTADDRLVTLVQLETPGEANEYSPAAVLDATELAAERYDIRSLIGQGGMGEIRLCIDRDIRRPIAMKRMLATRAQDSAFRARFVEEAQVTGQLEHPNIVPVHELGKDAEGNIYFTMKLVKGRSLMTMLEHMERGEEPHSLTALLEVFLKTCDGVAFAHSRGVVHRDLKPDNIMVGDYGEVLVMDWGLAKIVGRKDKQAEEAITSSRADQTSA